MFSLLGGAPSPVIPTLLDGQERLRNQEVSIQGNQVSSAVIDTLFGFPFIQKKRDFIDEIKSRYPDFRSLDAYGSPSRSLGGIKQRDFIEKMEFGFRQSYSVFADFMPTDRERRRRDNEARKDLGIYVQGIQDIVVVVISTLLKYYVRESHNAKFLVLVEWYKNKITTDPSYEQKGFFELLDIFFVYKESDGETYFGSIPSHLLDPVLDIIALSYILNGHIYQLGRHPKNLKVEQIDTVKAGIGILLGKIGDIKKTPRFQEQLIENLLGCGEKVYPKIRGKYEDSSLFQGFLENKLIFEKDGQKIEYPDLSGDAIFFIHQLVYSGWDFLIKTELCSSILIYLLGIMKELSEVKKGKILHFAKTSKIREISQEALLIVCLADIEDHAYVDSLSIGEISALGDIFIEQSPEGKFQAICDLAFIKDYTRDEVLYLQTLGSEGVKRLEKKDIEKDDVFGVKKILDEARADLSFLFPEHHGYQILSTFIEHTPRIGITAKEVEQGKNTIYSSMNLSPLIQTHKACRNLGYSQEHIGVFAAKLPSYTSDDIVFYGLMLPVVLGVSHSIQEKVLQYFPHLADATAPIILQDELLGFWTFLTESDFWGQDLELSYALFCESKDQVPIGKERQKEDKLENIFGTDIACYLKNFGFGERSLKSIEKLGEMMSVHFHDAFFSFCIGNEAVLREMTKDEASLLTRLQILQDILYLFGNLEFRILNSPEKLFDFLLLSDTITPEKYSSLQARIPELELQLPYNELLTTLMRFLKHGNISLLERALPQTQIPPPEENIFPKKEEKRKKGPSRNGIIKEDSSLAGEDRNYTDRLEDCSGNIGKFSEILKEIITQQKLLHIRVYIVCCIVAQSFGNEDLLKHTIENLKNRITQARGSLRIQEILGICRIFQSSEVSQEEKEKVWIGVQKSFFQDVGNMNFHTIAYIFFSVQGIITGYEKGIANMIRKLEIKIKHEAIIPFRDIYMFLTTLGFLREKSHFQKLIDMVFSKLKQNPLDDPIDAICARRIYALHDVIVPSQHLTRYEEAIMSKNQNGSSHAERIIYNAIKKRYPQAKLGMYIDGYEFDIFIDDVKINIEIDGEKSHAGFKKIRDALRDRYLLETYEITVVRLSASLKDIQESIDTLLNFLDTLPKK